MRISFSTLTLLSLLGDEEAKKAINVWIDISERNQYPVVPAAWLHDSCISIGPIWNE